MSKKLIFLLIVATMLFLISCEDNSTKSTHANIDSKLVFVPGGTFTMGRTTGEGNPRELPTHQVTLNSFYISKHQVTQAEYLAVMGANPEQPYNNGVGDNHPVYHVSWYDAVEYCNAKSAQDGLSKCYSYNGTNWKCNFNANGYRLPTESEWEYAARGATNVPDYLYSGSDDLENVAWYDATFDDPTHPVGWKAPNGLGLFDMSGNVWEWCYDLYSDYSEGAETNPIGPLFLIGENYGRVKRGGAASRFTTWYRVVARSYQKSSSESSSTGFRIARSDK